MVYRRFSVGITLRIVGIISCIFAGIWLYLTKGMLLAPIILGLGVLALAGEMIFYVNSINHKLARFLDSIRFTDFSSSFTSDSKMGGSFREVNKAFNEVMDVFKEIDAYEPCLCTSIWLLYICR